MAGSDQVVARIGIVNWNTAELVDQCLSALPAALDGLAADVVVVDNASADGSVDAIRRHPVHLICNQENLGYARAMNSALSPPWPPVLIALNPDTIPPPGSLSKLVQKLLDGPSDIGLLVPRLKYPDGRLQHSVYRFPSLVAYFVVWFLPRFALSWLARRYWIEGLAPHDRVEDIDWAIGAVHVIRSEALDTSYVYDERWFMYVEDIELCWRLRARGWRRMIDPEIEIAHVGNAAGSQAWGESRYERFMSASYDWYARDAGVLRTRMWAAVNVLGSLWFAAVHGLLSLGTRGDKHKESARWALGTVRIHLAPLLPGWSRVPAQGPTE